MKTRIESPNLDLMRSLAVLFVVVFHVLLLFQKTHVGPLNLHSIGQWGVLMFFVHTSLVLMLSLERQEMRLGQEGLKWVFYLRRFFRIYPLSVLTVLLVAMLRLPVADLHGYFSGEQATAREVISDVLLVQNLNHAGSVIAVLWSLPYEIQMYLILPIFFLLARSCRGILPLVGVWFGFVIVALVAIRTHHLANVVIYVPCFIPGIIAYKLGKSGSGTLPFYLWPATIVAMTAVFLEDPVNWMGWICCLIIGLSIPAFSEMRHSGLNYVCHLIARYSYGIYLTHLICLWLAFDRFSTLPMADRWIIFGLSVVVIPVILYHGIEKPMIELGSRWAEQLWKNPESKPA